MYQAVFTCSFRPTKRRELGGSGTRLLPLPEAGICYLSGAGILWTNKYASNKTDWVADETNYL